MWGKGVHSCIERTERDHILLFNFFGARQMDCWLTLNKSLNKWISLVLGGGGKEGMRGWWEVACAYGTDNFLKKGGLKARTSGHLITVAFYSCLMWIIGDYLLKARAQSGVTVWLNLPVLSFKICLFHGFHLVNNRQAWSVKKAFLINGGSAQPTFSKNRNGFYCQRQPLWNHKAQLKGLKSRSIKDFCSNCSGLQRRAAEAQ